MKCKYLIFLTLIACVSSCNSCNEVPDYCDRPTSNYILTLENQSNIPVNWNSSFISDSIFVYNGEFGDINDNLILTGHQFKLRSDNCWSEFTNGYSEWYYFFHHDTITAIGWAGVSGTNRGLLKRVKVDSIYLENNNYTISYP
jgi:hypothetical protein